MDDTAEADRVRHLRGPRAGDDRRCQHLGRDLDRGRAELVADAVGTDDDVEVDRTPCLVLDDFDVAQPDGLLELGRRRGGKAGECPEGVDRRPPPELAEQRMEHDVFVVAIAVGADRLADDRIVGPVMGEARERATMGAPTRRRGGMTGTGSRLPAGVHGTERRGRQGDKGHGMGGDRLRDALPAGEPGHDEVAGIVAVDVGAREASRLSPVAAGLHDDALAVPVAAGDLPGLAVDQVVATEEADRMRAVMRLAQLGLERVDATGRMSPGEHRIVQLALCSVVRRGGEDSEGL